MTAAVRPRPRTRVITSISFVICYSLFVISVTPALAQAVHGTVFDPERRPVGNADIIVTGPAAPIQLKSAADGSFTVPTLGSGRYYISAHAPGLSADAVPIDDAREIELVMRLTAINESLVVSAAQIDQPLSRTPDSVTVLAGEEIAARQQFTLGAALRSVPGLTLQQSGGPGALTSLFTRGGESDYTLVLVDGVRVNAFGGGLDFSQVPLQDVERIEVLRGSQSALYGADAIGGVIQVITRSGGDPSAQAQFEAGSRDMRRAAASTSGEAGGIRWQLGGNYLRDDGVVVNDDTEQAQLSASLGWRHDRNGADVLGSLQYVDTERGSPGPYGSDPANRFSGIDTISRGSTIRMGGGVRWVQPWFGSASRVRQRVEIDRADYDLAFNSRFGISESETQRSHVRVQTDVAAASQLGWSAGLEWIGEQGGSTFIVGGAAGAIPVKRGVLGLFGESRWTPGERATITAGVRGERITRDALPGDPTAFQPRPDFPEETIISVNPKIAASFAVHEQTRVRGSFGTGIRPPDAFEIAFTDNAGLKPERSKSGEIGVTHRLGGAAVQLDATGFFNHYTDLIISVGRAFSGISRYRTDNISNARARGAELGAAWRVIPAVDLRASYTFLDSEILAVRGSNAAQTPYSVGDPLLRRPRHAGSIDGAWTHARASAFAQVQVRGKTLDADPAFGPTGGLFPNPGHTVINIGASWRPLKAMEVFARALNLFDRKYEEVLGYPAPGRSAYVGARVAVGR
jgi:outer membrane cobalamin receptor